jgi:hypothetical protein
MAETERIQSYTNLVEVDVHTLQLEVAGTVITRNEVRDLV